MRERVGFRNEARSLLLTKAIRQPMAARDLPVPTVEGYLHLAAVVGCSAEVAKLELATDESDERAADEVWHRFGLPAGNRVIVLNSGGAFGAAKMWPAEYFSELAAATRERRDIFGAGQLRTLRT